MEIKAELTPEELNLSNQLKNKIVTQINQNGGAISISTYIELALYEPNWGYYANLLHKFGKAGDFYTAPMISNLFAQCLAKQIQELWDQSEVDRNLLEIGPGNGDLMLELLNALGDVIDNYFILEISANLTSFQRERVAQLYPQLLHKIVWLEQLPQEFEGLILANEVLDAQPTEVVVWHNNEIFQRYVTVNEKNNFVYTQQPIKSKNLKQVAQQLKINADYYISEINLNNRGFMHSLAECLNVGFILLIDYGYSQNEYYAPSRFNGTLRGFFRQFQLDDVLIYPGLIDITSSVDFTAIANAAIQSNLDFIGFTNQGNFLINCGLLNILQQKHKTVNNLEYLKLAQQVKYLTAEEEMGEIFKVIAFSKKVEFSDWLGFKYNDRSHIL
ncbi:MAG: SAM-dependent methyltransferase [Burkholderiales bacterium]|nr:SAM-dependent methyltransferase [Burkholderiales bacterium]